MGHVTRKGLHVSGIEGYPVHIIALEVVNGVFEERMTGCCSHKSVVDSGGNPGWGNPVYSGEEVQRDFACDVEIKVYASEFVEDEVSNHVGALNF